MRFNEYYVNEEENQIYTDKFKNWFGDWENNPNQSSKVVDKDGKPLVVYHGTNKEFTDFDRQYSAQGVHWFSSDKDKIQRGEAGALSSKIIMPIYLNLRKIAGWDDYEKLGLGQIEDMGFDGIKLDDDYIVFDEKNIKSAVNNKGTFNPNSTNINEDENTIRLYRGLEKKLDTNYDLTQTDAPTGYSTWTDNLDLAQQYAGKDGFVYYIDLPKSQLGDEIIDDDPNSETYGDRVLFFNNEKKAGLNGISGDEYLVYNNHDMFDVSMIKEV